MRVRASKDGVTLRVIAGTHSVLLAMDLAPAVRPGCLGFSIERTDLDTGTGQRRWLPNLLRFHADGRPASTWITTASAPLQKFRWGDYTVEPGRRYRYRAVARYGAADEVLKQGVLAEKPGGFDALPGGVSVEVRTEDSRDPATAVFFNRGAAASKAYNDKFGDNDPDNIPAAREWLSRGLEEAILGYLGQAEGAGFALHAVIYEFQKDSLLAGLKAAMDRGVDVQAVYHARKKADDKPKKPGDLPKETDHTLRRNQEAIAKAGLQAVCTPRAAGPPDAIMHDKYVVLLKDGEPQAVWTGSTNWTDGGVYGQLNVGHAVYDRTVAQAYEKSFQLLKKDLKPDDTKTANEAITPLPGVTRAAVPHGVTPLFSPQHKLDMLDLYADVCGSAKLLMVSAPFELHKKIMDVLTSAADTSVMRFVLADSERSLGGQVQLMNRAPAFAGAVATTLKSALHDYQDRLLEDRESFHHAGVHVHSKIIAADPLGPDPVLIIGSANFSSNSTTKNDSNVLVFRGDTAIADIYVTDFMRMFEHYWFRYRLAVAEAKSEGKAEPAKDGPAVAPSKEAAQAPHSVGMGLRDDDTWSLTYYVAGSRDERDRLTFVGAA